MAINRERSWYRVSFFASTRMCKRIFRAIHIFEAHVVGDKRTACSPFETRIRLLLPHLSDVRFDIVISEPFVTVAWPQ